MPDISEDSPSPDPLQFRVDYQLLLGPVQEFLAIMHRTFYPLMAFGADILPRAQDAAARLEPLQLQIDTLTAEIARLALVATEISQQVHQKQLEAEDAERVYAEVAAEREKTWQQQGATLEAVTQRQVIQCEEAAQAARQRLETVMAEVTAQEQAVNDAHLSRLAGWQA